MRGGDVVAGVAVRADRLDDSGYAELAGRLFGSVTPENELKWDAVEPEPGEFFFGAAEEVVEFAERNDQRVRGHALVWHSQLPSWVRGTEREMRRHIERVAGHFGDRINTWDVVNEALADDGGARETPFLREQGPDYVARAFEIAREAAPGARLAYNDYGAESPESAKGRSLFLLVRELKRADVPIDAVGFQTHVDPGRIRGFERQLRRVAALGVDVELTEVDVKLPAEATQADLDAQAVAYGRIVRACLAVKRCTSITFWGVSDADSWIPEFFPGFGNATLLDEELRPKPAYRAVREALAGGG